MCGRDVPRSGGRVQDGDVSIVVGCGVEESLDLWQC
jgi:hypothetical protein